MAAATTNIWERDKVRYKEVTIVRGGMRKNVGEVSGGITFSVSM